MSNVKQENFALSPRLAQEIQRAAEAAKRWESYRLRDWSVREYALGIVLMEMGVRVEVADYPSPGNPQPVGKVDHTFSPSQKHAITLRFKRLYESQRN